MKRIILGLVATAAVATPIALAAPANAAPAPKPAKATGSVAWVYGSVTGSVEFSANDKTGGTLDYTDSTGQTIHGVVTPGTVVKTGTTITFAGKVTDSNMAWNLNQPFTGVVIDGGEGSHNTGDQIGLFVNRAVDDVLADVNGGNLQVH